MQLEAGGLSTSTDSRRAVEAVEAVADVAGGLRLAAAGRLGGAALAAAAVPLDRRLATLLHLARRAQHDAQVHWVSAAAAVQLLLGKPAGQDAGDAGAVVRELLLPLLAAQPSSGDAAAAAAAAVAPQAQKMELVQAVASVAAHCGSWELGLHLVQAADGSASDAGGAAGLELPADVQARLAAAVIQQAIQSASSEDQLMLQGPRELLRHAACSTLPHALATAAAEPALQQPKQQAGGKPAAAAARAAAVLQLLLPAALHAACLVGQEAGALQQLWATCRQLLEAGSRRRQQGLALLVRFAGPLLGGGPGPQGQGERWQGAQQDPALWPLLRACLCDRDASGRKRAAHVLRLALLLEAQDGKGPWLPCHQPSGPAPGRASE